MLAITLCRGNKCRNCVRYRPPPPTPPLPPPPAGGWVEGGGGERQLTCVAFTRSHLARGQWVAMCVACPAAPVAESEGGAIHHNHHHQHHLSDLRQRPSVNGISPAWREQPARHARGWVKTICDRREHHKGWAGMAGGRKRRNPRETGLRSITWALGL